MFGSLSERYLVSPREQNDVNACEIAVSGTFNVVVRCFRLVVIHHFKLSLELVHFTAQLLRYHVFRADIALSLVGFQLLVLTKCLLERTSHTGV